MADLLEDNEWTPGIYQLETSDPVLGGPDGIDNLQAKQLASRTGWLKAQVALLGEGKQPLDATLTALADLILAGDKLIYATGVDTFATTALSSFIRTLLDDVDAAAARTTLGAAPLANPALTGTPTAPTQAQFDNSKALATTEFVKVALGNCKGLVPISANTTLTPAQVGSYITSNAGGGAVSVALPLLSTVAAGAMFIVSHSSSAMASFGLVTSGSDALIFEGLSGNAGPYGMSVDETVFVVSTGVAWKVVAGNGARSLKAGGGFASVLGVNGVQKLPGGTIIQRGSGSTNAGTSVVTFPIAFPAACRQVIAFEAGAVGWSATNFTVYGSTGKSTTGATIKSLSWNGSAFSPSASSGAFDYIALGE
ncbi:MAG: gp53-like domain-containing protein [Pseudomonas fluorescens]